MVKCDGGVEEEMLRAVGFEGENMLNEWTEMKRVNRQLC